MLDRGGKIRYRSAEGDGGGDFVGEADLEECRIVEQDLGYPVGAVGKGTRYPGKPFHLTLKLVHLGSVHGDVLFAGTVVLFEGLVKLRAFARSDLLAMFQLVRERLVAMLGLQCLTQDLRTYEDG